MKLKLIIPIVLGEDRVRRRVMDRMAESVRTAVSDGVSVDMECLTHGTSSIEGRADGALNQPGVLALALRSQHEGYDGIFVSDMDNCGVEAAREVVDIPVVGGFAPSALTALHLGRRIALITILDRVVPMQTDHFRTLGIESNLACILVADAGVADLIEDPQPAVEAVFQQCCRAADEFRAEVAILGCTGFIGVAALVNQRLAATGRTLRVLDPNRVALSSLEHLVRSGLTSSRTAYPKRPGPLPA